MLHARIIAHDTFRMRLFVLTHSSFLFLLPRRSLSTSKINDIYIYIYIFIAPRSIRHRNPFPRLHSNLRHRTPRSNQLPQHPHLHQVLARQPYPLTFPVMFPLRWYVHFRVETHSKFFVHGFPHTLQIIRILSQKTFFFPLVDLFDILL